MLAVNAHAISRPHIVRSTARPKAFAPARKPSLRASSRTFQPSAQAGSSPAPSAPDVTDNTWEQLVLQSDVPVVVDFWAPWCGPCRMIAPIIDEIASDFGDKIKVLKLNTDESPQVATQYGIRSIPTVMVFKNGQRMDAVIGAVPKSTLVTAIEKYLS